MLVEYVPEIEKYSMGSIVPSKEPVEFNLATPIDNGLCPKITKTFPYF